MKHSGFCFLLRIQLTISRVVLMRLDSSNFLRLFVHLALAMGSPARFITIFIVLSGNISVKD